MDGCQNLSDDLNEILFGEACLVNNEFEILAFREVRNDAVQIADKHSGY
jgi:hypothetical protein